MIQICHCPGLVSWLQKKTAEFTTFVDVRVNLVIPFRYLLPPSSSHSPDNNYVLFVWRHVHTAAMRIVRVHRLQRDSSISYLVPYLLYCRFTAIVLQGYIVPCVYFRNTKNTKFALHNRSERYVHWLSARVSSTIIQDKVEIEMKGERIIFLYNPPWCLRSEIILVNKTQSIKYLE
jgi:hypothetical protein